MKKHSKIIMAILTALLTLSMGFIIYIAFCGGDSLFWLTYQQSPNEIYNMESGIIYNAIVFRDGENYQLHYDFDHEENAELLDTYHVKEIACNGSEFEQAKNLMNEFSGRLTHKSNYDNHIAMNALDLLEYSLDNKKQGMNCRNKAQILNEMCLALGIYSRKVWIMPNSVYDNDCHVVNEVWDSSYCKWIMLDITNNMYWVDETGTPLSILEIREKIANQKFCTPVTANDKLNNLNESLDKNFDIFLYIAKNMVWMQYCETYTADESDMMYILYPENMDTDYEYIISEEAINAAPPLSSTVR